MRNFCELLKKYAVYFCWIRFYYPNCRPALNFYEMGMQKGDVLVWKDDPSISVSIISDRKVCYEGEELSISALSAKLKGYKTKHIAPGPHWFFNDKLLSDIYDETYPFDE